MTDPLSLHSASPTLVAAATSTTKTVNQDACAVVQTAHASCGVIIADGIGSHYGAELASAAAITHLRERLEVATDPASADLAELYAAVRVHLQSLFGAAALDVDRNLAYGTTLLCALDTPRSWRLAYVGNGAIYHLRGNFNAFPPSRILPWNAVNYLNPHTIAEAGQSVLCRYLSPFVAQQVAVPTVLMLEKDAGPYGDIIVVCSDGVASCDQVPIGRDPERRVWIGSEPGFALLLEHLAGFFATAELTSPGLQLALRVYLDDLERRGLVHDDCAVGVLVGATALRYQESRLRVLEGTR